LPGTPFGVAVTPDDTRVYVTNNSLSSVAVIDAASNTAIDSIPLGTGYPLGVRVTPNGAAVYVAQSQPSYLRVIGTRCDEVDKTVAVGDLPNAIAIGPGPAGPPPPPPVPLTTHVTAIEVTQAIQNVANDVPLIIGKRAFARVYVEADGAAVAGVTATLSGLGSYMSGGGSVSVPLGPLTPSNPTGPRITVPFNPKRSNGGDGFLFELPYEWTLFEGLRLHAELSAPNAAPVPSCARDVASAPLLEFRRFTTLKVAFVRMGYQLPGVFANPADAMAQTSSGEQRDSESFMRRMFPVSQLTFAPDLILFDPFLGSFVDQSNLFCQAGFSAETRNLCARRM
jgi:YVTN family beta-propeller protein